jgi:hypothetical protein
MDAGRPRSRPRGSVTSIGGGGRIPNPSSPPAAPPITVFAVVRECADAAVAGGGPGSPPSVASPASGRPPSVRKVRPGAPPPVVQAPPFMKTTQVGRWGASWEVNDCGLSLRGWGCVSEVLDWELAEGFWRGVDCTPPPAPNSRRTSHRDSPAPLQCLHVDFWAHGWHWQRGALCRLGDLWLTLGIGQLAGCSLLASIILLLGSPATCHARISHRPLP